MLQVCLIIFIDKVSYCSTFLNVFDPLLQFEALSSVYTKTCRYDITNFLRTTEYRRLQYLCISIMFIWWQAEITDSTTNFKSSRYIRLYTTIENYSQQILLVKGRNIYRFWLVLTSFIFFINISGLLPYSFTLTSQLLVMLAVAFIAIGVIWVKAAYYKKIYFFAHFLPHGVPIFILPLILIIEFISNISRVISLAVRVFANITAGHALLKILIGFIFIILSATVAGLLSSVVLYLATVVVFILELIIAAIQAYVFGSLFYIYVAEITV
jgi:F-type H+-transporting ATPase subunit a